MASGDSFGPKEDSYTSGSSEMEGSEETFDYECNACKLDNMIKEAKFYCYDCEDLLCNDCESFHKKVKMTRSHQIVLVSNIPVKGHDQKAVTGSPSKTGINLLCSCNQLTDVEFYCADHKEVFCTVCRNVHHYRCHTATISDGCQTESFAKDFKTTLGKVDNLLQKACKIEEKAREVQASLEMMEHSCKNEIKLFRKEINLLFDRLEEQIMEDLKGKTKEQSDLLQKCEETVKSTLNLVNTDRSRAEEVMKVQDKRHMFITYIKIDKSLLDYEATLGICQQTLTSTRPKFQNDSNLKDFLEKLDSLGSINSYRMSSGEVNFLKMELKSHTTFGVTTVADKSPPWITGVAFLTDGNILVADNKNKRLTLIEVSRRSKKASLQCDWKPWDVAAIDDKALVSFPDKKELRYLQVGENLQFLQTIKLEVVVHGLAHAQGCIYCHGRNEVLILDMSGNILRILEKKRSELSDLSGVYQYYIAASAVENKIYLQDNYKVLCSTTTGKLIFERKDSTIEPRGIIVDDQGNLLVCSLGSDNIYVIKSDGSIYKPLLSQTHQIRAPYSIAYRATDGTLVVGDYVDYSKGRLHILKLQ